MSPGMSLVIAGFGSFGIEKRSERGIAAFALDAALAALADAGVTRDDIDGYVGAPFATNAGSPHAEGGDEISLKTVASLMGLRLSWGADLYRRYPTDMVASAAHALQAGTCRFVLGLRALYVAPGLDYATAATERVFGADQFTKPYGYSTAGARFAARAWSYMARHGATRDDLFAIVDLSRRNAALNPEAIWRDKPFSRADYDRGRMIAEPHGLFDCDLPVCGAQAFVMCRAQDLPQGAHPARVTGFSGFARPEALWSMSGRSVADLKTAQLYDGFSSMVWEWLDGLGITPPGGAPAFLRDGHAEPGARLPLNTFGGALGEGRLHGMGHLREAYLQASGRAGPRQQATGPALVQVGPYDDSSFVLLEPATA
ncbi:thiolase C-terminal domain-containing protein [Pararhodobacter marinus]|uniref:thiolase C-terminal domain-containing protein n=2 Tax=Pararhodobacter marinus TaxID=2184063 RepID=UPI003559A8A3